MDELSAYEVALVGPVAEPRARHTIGLPNGEEIPMAPATLLVLAAAPDGTAMLFRYAGDGACCGDTWHESVSAARDQAAWEYEGALGPWTPAPSACADLDDAIRFAEGLRDAAAGPT